MLIGVGFDAYAGSTRERSAVGLLELAGRGLRGASIQPRRGFKHAPERFALVHQGVDCAWSGSGAGGMADLVVFEVKGELTEHVVANLRSSLVHQVSRVDVAADFDAPGVFDRLVDEALSVKRRYRLKGEKRGDWEDHPEEGRSLYVGSPKSAAMLRVYEKGRQPEFREQGRSDWVRAELQARPQSSSAKRAYAFVTASQGFNATPWASDFAGRIGVSVEDAPALGKGTRVSDHERAWRYMLKQYRNVLMREHALLGDWESVGKTIGEALSRGDHC